MPIFKLKEKRGGEFTNPSFKRGFWKNFLTVFGLLTVIVCLVFLSYLLYVGPPMLILVDEMFNYFNNLFVSP